jgi:hypothetical protein
MSTFWWRKADPGGDGPGADLPAEVNEQHALPVALYWADQDQLAAEGVSVTRRFPVEDGPLLTQVRYPIRFASSVGFTRPADTTAYAAGDVMSTATSTPVGAIYVPNLARSPGALVTIVGVRAFVSNTAQVARVRLVWFRTNPANIDVEQRDNVAFAFTTKVGRDNCVGSTLMGAWTTKGMAELVAAQEPLVTSPTETGLYLLPTCEDAETPPNTGVYRFDFYTL